MVRGRTPAALGRIAARVLFRPVHADGDSGPGGKCEILTGPRPWSGSTEHG